MRERRGRDKKREELERMENRSEERRHSSKESTQMHVWLDRHTTETSNILKYRETTSVFQTKLSEIHVPPWRRGRRRNSILGG